MPTPPDPAPPDPPTPLRATPLPILPYQAGKLPLWYVPDEDLKGLNLSLGISAFGATFLAAPFIPIVERLSFVCTFCNAPLIYLVAIRPDFSRETWPPAAAAHFLTVAAR